jgi:uncharacterized membrane protein YbhN (UPF0104 family)
MADEAAERQPRSRLRVRSFRWYSSDPGAPLRRRPTDGVLLGISAVALLLLAPVAPGPSTIDQSLTTAIQALPSWLTWTFSAGYATATLWAVVLVIVPMLTPHRRLLGPLLLLAAFIAFAVAGLAGAFAGTAWDGSWAALWTDTSPPVYTAVRVGVITAVITAASPHLAYPIRLVGRVLLGVVAVSAVAIGIAYPIGALAGFLLGVAAAALSHLIVGSPGGHPSPARIAEALADLGIDDADVIDHTQPSSAAAAYSAHLPGGEALSINVLGRDDWNSQLLASSWATATRRGEHLSIGATRLARVEHAALMSVLAERAGVRVPAVVVAGRSAESDCLLVTRGPTGASLADLAPEDAHDGLLDEAWQLLAVLHDAGIAHRRIDGTRLILDQDGLLTLVDFAQACGAAEPRELMFDRARLLAATALVVGADRAVASAQRVLGDAGLVALLPFLQPAVLDRATRARISDGEWDLAALRDRVVVVTGVEAPKLEQVRRVSVRSLVQAALIVLVTYGLISALSGVDFSEIWADLQSADWAWLAAALVVAPLAQVFFGFSTLGATTASLRYLPVLLLQYALQFIALVLPATAARIAMDVRFFQSFGVASGAAVSIGIVDSFSGFVVQCLLLVSISLSSLPGFTQPVPTTSSATDTSSSTSSDPSALTIMLMFAVISVAIVMVVPHLRRRYLGRVRGALSSLRDQAGQARGALTVLRHPTNVAQMLGGNLGGQVVQAAVLGLCLAAFGQHAAMSQLILINTAVSLFAGLMPVPGGVGVTEAGITAGLQAIGIPSSIAISVAISFRLVTFYLPPLWGSMALQWLRRGSYV